MEQLIGAVAVIICILFATAIFQGIQGSPVTLPKTYTVLGLILSGRVLAKRSGWYFLSGYFWLAYILIANRAAG